MFNSIGGGAGAGGQFGGVGTGGGFPAPGIPNSNSNSNAPSTTSANTANPAAPFNMFAPSVAGAGGEAAAGNPFAMDPAAVQQMLSMMGGMGGMGGGTPAPTDTRPPEERFQVQLQVGHIIFFSFLKVRTVVGVGLSETHVYSFSMPVLFCPFPRGTDTVC